MPAGPPTRAEAAVGISDRTTWTGGWVYGRGVGICAETGCRGRVRFTVLDGKGRREGVKASTTTRSGERSLRECRENSECPRGSLYKYFLLSPLVWGGGGKAFVLYQTKPVPRRFSGDRECAHALLPLLLGIRYRRITCHCCYYCYYCNYYNIVCFIAGPPP